MNLLEFLICAFICALLFTFTIPRQTHTAKLAADTLHFHLQGAQILALTDDRFHTSKSQGAKIVELLPSVEPAKLAYQAKNAFWQFQLHIVRDVFATRSYSVYVDTPRSATSTNFDARPYPGDLIALDSGRRCLSGYASSNTSVECRNNKSINVRLAENLGITHFELIAPKICAERDTGRIYFDHLGMPYCAKIPVALDSAILISLGTSNNVQNICILKNGKIMRNC